MNRFWTLTNPTLLTLVQNVLLSIVLVVIAFLLDEPLALLGLLAIAALPLVPTDHLAIAAGLHLERQDEDSEGAGYAVGEDERLKDPEMGFTAKLRTVQNE